MELFARLTSIRPHFLALGVSLSMLKEFLYVVYSFISVIRVGRFQKNSMWLKNLVEEEEYPHECFRRYIPVSVGIPSLRMH